MKSRTTFVVLWLLILCTLGFELAIADRGFEITDEGMALVAAAAPEEIRIAPTGFAWTTGPLFSLVGHEPAAFRRAGVLVLALCGSVLAWGVTRRVPSLSLREAAPLGALGALVFLDPGLTLPSYNFVASCGSSLAIGLFLAASADRGRRAAWLFVSSGFALGVAGLAKPPGGVGIGLLLASSAFFWRWSWRPAFWVSGGALAVAQQLARQGPGDFATMVMDGLEFNRRLEGGYGLGSMASRYSAEWLRIIANAFLIAIPALVVLYVARRFFTDHKHPATRLLWLALGASLVLQGAHAGGHRPATSGRSAAAIGAILLVVAVETARAKRDPPRRRLALLLLAAPLLALIGTNTPVGFSVMFFCAPWFLVPAVLQDDSTPSPGGAILAAMAVGFLVQGPFFSPYRRAPLSEMTASVQVGAAGARLKVDPETARFLRAYRGAALSCGLRPGTPILAFSWVPGLVWAAGGRTAGITHFVNGFFPGARSANEFALSRVPLADARRAFVLLTSAGERVHPTLTIGGRRLPDDGYRLCFEGEWPASRESVRLYGPPGSDPPTR